MLFYVCGIRCIQHDRDIWPILSLFVLQHLFTAGFLFPSFLFGNLLGRVFVTGLLELIRNSGDRFDVDSRFQRGKRLADRSQKLCQWLTTLVHVFYCYFRLRQILWDLRIQFIRANTSFRFNGVQKCLSGLVTCRYGSLVALQGGRSPIAWSDWILPP